MCLDTNKTTQISKKNIDLIERIVESRRVSITKKGGKKPSYRTIVFVGDKQGKIGVGIAKSTENRDSRDKALKKATKSMVNLSLNANLSISRPYFIKGYSNELMLLPAKAGTGLKGSGVVRSFLELLGAQNAVCKTRGSRSSINVVKLLHVLLYKYGW